MDNQHLTATENEKSDAELIELAKIDPESFGLLMKRYQIPLFHYIRRLTQLPKEDAEDLLQEVFIKIYQKLNEYNELLKFSSWAYRITHNHIIDFFRKTSARPKTNSLEEYELAKLLKSKTDMAKELGSKDCLEKMKVCLEKLPLKYKDILVLRFLEEKSYEEIMDILRKPKGSVATLIARGREMLLANMKKEGIDCFDK
ncbi:MAG: RNA polymerase sigma factor [Parcubacteria group bacterium]|jgi:RNA polymerase sigma-70 factor (ECF subfamily)